MSVKTIKYGLYVAGLFNIVGVLGFSMFFTNPHIAKYYPSVFSDFGLIAIMLWGLAYIASASFYNHARTLMFVFALEKFIYVVTWILFMTSPGRDLPQIFDESVMTGMFYAAYGAGDFAFGCFFAWVGLKGYRIEG